MIPLPLGNHQIFWNGLKWLFLLLYELVLDLLGSGMSGVQSWVRSVWSCIWVVGTWWRRVLKWLCLRTCIQVWKLVRVVFELLECPFWSILKNLRVLAEVFEHQSPYHLACKPLQLLIAQHNKTTQHTSSKKKLPLLWNTMTIHCIHHHHWSTDFEHGLPRHLVYMLNTSHFWEWPWNLNWSQRMELYGNCL